MQLSLDVNMSPQGHYDLAKGLTALRRKGVLIMGSGNMVHNLRRIALPAGSTTGFNTRFGLDWALEANALMKSLIDSGQHDKLADYQSLGSAVRLAVPTPEHYLPLLYALALKEDADALSYFNDYALAGSLTMTSLIIDRSV